MSGREIWSSDDISGFITLRLPEGQYKLLFEGAELAPLSTFLVLSHLTLSACGKEDLTCYGTDWKCPIYEQCVLQVMNNREIIYNNEPKHFQIITKYISIIRVGRKLFLL